MDGVALSPLTVAFHDPAFNAALGPELRASDTDRDTLHGGGPYNPQDLNRYSYARNNPVRYTDPTGHWTFSIDVSISGGAYLGGSISGGLVIDGHGNVDVYQTTQWGGTIGASVGLSGGATITGADTIDQTTGPGFEIGINTPIVSANVPIGGNKDYAGFGLAFGPAAGGDIHINKTNTVTKPASSLNPITKMKEIYREGERALRDTIVSAKYR
ncbi:MAG: hypothetical protein GFH24_608350n108 [Chloroflexi bacterium AL-N5]|nr:hypothetical protein [Chloroflexi bacterium AL-N5]